MQTFDKRQLADKTADGKQVTSSDLSGEMSIVVTYTLQFTNVAVEMV